MYYRHVSLPALVLIGCDEFYGGAVIYAEVKGYGEKLARFEKMNGFGERASVAVRKVVVQETAAAKYVLEWTHCTSVHLFRSLAAHMG